MICGAVEGRDCARSAPDAASAPETVRSARVEGRTRRARVWCAGREGVNDRGGGEDRDGALRGHLDDQEDQGAGPRGRGEDRTHVARLARERAREGAPEAGAARGRRAHPRRRRPPSTARRVSIAIEVSVAPSLLRVRRDVLRAPPSLYVCRAGGSRNAPPRRDHGLDDGRTTRCDRRLRRSRRGPGARRPVALRGASRGRARPGHAAP